MASVDLRRFEHRARVAYEWGRLRRALIGFAPALLLSAIAAWISGRPLGSLPFGVALFLAGVVALWYGREPKRAVLPGITAGLIPVVLTLGALRIGDFCFGDRCATACMAACVVGGVGAGVAVGLVGMRRRSGLSFWLAASVLAMLTGAMSCVCLGYSGLVGLAAGYGVGILPALALRANRG